MRVTLFRLSTRSRMRPLPFSRWRQRTRCCTIAFSTALRTHYRPNAGRFRNRRTMPPAAHFLYRHYLPVRGILGATLSPLLL